VWAVGSAQAKPYGAPLVVHWDGQRWRTLGMSRPRNRDALDWELDAVAVSPTAAWAAWAAPSEVFHAAGYPLVVRANSSQATVMPSPEAIGMPYLTAVETLGPRSIWVAGVDPGKWQSGQRPGGGGSFVARWNGRHWHTTPLQSGELVNDLTADQAGGLWAVGLVGSGWDLMNGFPDHTKPLIMRLGC
jgi:hypothetical protein